MSTRSEALDPADPRLTAYALAELEIAERAEVERLLESSPAAREFTDALRSTAQALKREYGMELEGTPHTHPLFTASHVIAAASAMSWPRRIWLHAVGQALMLSSAVLLFALSSGWSEEEAPASDIACAAIDEIEASPSNPNVTLAIRSETTAPPNATEGVLERKVLTQEEAASLDHSTAIGVGFSAHRGTSSFSTRTLSGSGRAGGPTKPAGGQLNGFHLNAAQGGVDATKQNTEAYASTGENPFKLPANDPLSTFSIDVDTASYANTRRFLNGGQLPPVDAVRLEEFVNYFRYAYPKPRGTEPFSSQATVASCPWAPTHKLVQIGLRARDIEHAKRPSSNLVFLIDVSGSMDDPLKLPLLVRSMRMLVDQLDERDRIAIVVYAGSSGLVLPSTNCSWKAVILDALDRLQAGGSTNGGEGIELAYKIAAENFITHGQNRVVLCTDGDFNVGVTSAGELTLLVEEKRKSNVFLSVLGFGQGNVKDSTMELLADKGNGNYAYVDSLAEARKVLVAEMGGTLFTVAKDVKIQVEFNPARVQAWRLIGYENRVLAHKDFNDDTKDAGEIGAGHTVTAMYEVVPIGVRFEPGIDALRYQTPPRTTAASYTDELLTLKLRYKAPTGDTSQLVSTPVKDSNTSWQDANQDFKFAAAVAGFGMVLRRSQNAGGYTMADVLNLATAGIGDDVGGYRTEFLALVRKAQTLVK